MAVDLLMTRPDLIVGLGEDLGEDIVDDALTELRASCVKVELLRTPQGPFGGLELYLPTVVGLFVLSAFFTGFLSKAGEDSYEAVKRGAKLLYRKARQLDVTLVGTPGKVKDLGYSHAFAIGCEILPTLRIKLLIPREASPDDVERGIDAFMDLMRLAHDGRIGPAALDDLLRHPPVGGTALVRYDASSGKIVPVGGLADQRVSGSEVGGSADANGVGEAGPGHG